MTTDEAAWLATLKAHEYSGPQSWANESIRRLLSIVERQEAEIVELRSKLYCESHGNERPCYICDNDE